MNTSKLPTTIDGTPVRPVDFKNPITIRGHVWYSLMPTNWDDYRIWEHCPETGRTILTVSDPEECE